MSPNANCIVAEKVSDNEVRLYQYVPGQLATQYTFKADATVMVEDIVEKSIDVVVENRNIKILGNAQSIEIYTVGGVLIAKDCQEITCQAGIYLVKVDGEVKKVIVR